MKKLRANITATLIASIIFVAMPAGAVAGPLLSGYGGPGEGNQAILGAALLNGSGNGKGGQGGGGSESSSSSGTSSSASVRSRTEGVAKGGARGGSSSGGGARTSTSSQSHESALRSPAYTPLSSQPITQTAATTSTGTAGLSGADLLYILLAVAVLVLTGAITRRVARPAR